MILYVCLCRALFSFRRTYVLVKVKQLYYVRAFCNNGLHTFSKLHVYHSLYSYVWNEIITHQPAAVDIMVVL